MKSNLQIILNALESSYNFATSAYGQPITDTVPAFADGINHLGDSITEIKDLIGPQTQDLSGYTVHKHELIADLALKSIINIRPAMAYAKVNDNELYGKLLFGGINQKKKKYSSSLIKHMKQSLIVAALTEVHDLISDNLTDIQAWGLTSITTTTLADMQTAIDAFEAYYTTPRNKMAERVVDTQLLEEKVITINRYARTVLDPLVESFLISNNVFYRQWFVNRRQITLGVHHTRLVAEVIDELGNPFVNATVTVDELNKDGKTYRAVSSDTDINGNTTVEKFEQGNRMVTVSGEGVVEKQFGPLHFQNGKAIILTFTCQPAFNNLPAPNTEEEKEKSNK